MLKKITAKVVLIDGSKFFKMKFKLFVCCAFLFCCKASFAAETSILIMHYGQSNAGVNYAGEAIDLSNFSSGQVLMPNDIGVTDEAANFLYGGTRGWAGAARSEAMTALVPVDEALTRVQSVVYPAGISYQHHRTASGDSSLPTKVIVRSEARGGQRFYGERGLFKKSLNGDFTTTYLGLIQSVEAIAALAEVQGAPLTKIYIPFSHQEANRNNPAQHYKTQLETFMDSVENDLAGLSVPVVWLLDQAAGADATGAGSRYSGNDWEPRLVMKALADERDQVYFVGPRYPYALADRLHWSNTARIMYGELLGSAIYALERGEDWVPGAVQTITQYQNFIDVKFTSSEAIVIDDDTSRLQSDSVAGFTLTSDDGTTIVSALPVGRRTIRLELNQVPSAGALQLNYAYRPGFTSDVDNNFAVGNGLLRHLWNRPSVFTSVTSASKVLWWVPGFSHSLSTHTTNYY